MISATLLNPSFDLLYSVPTPNKTTYLDVPARFFPAGKGVNFAKVVAELGEPVSLYSLMPEQDSARFTDYLDSRGVEHYPYNTPGTVRINTTIFEETTGSTVHYNSLGQQLSAQVQHHFEQFLIQKIKCDDVWAFSGSLPQGIENNFYEKMISHCSKIGATTVLDSRGEPFKRALFSAPCIVSPNEDEIESLYEEPVQGIKQLALKGKRLVDSGVETVFITLGADGVLALNSDECLLCKTPEVVEVDTVGCGDAFLAGVVVGMQRGFSFREVCRLAVSCGASNASNIGPGEVNSDQVWHLMEQVSAVSL